MEARTSESRLRGTRTRPSRWWLVLAALLIAVLATLVVKLSPLARMPVAVLARAPASCDLLRRPCTAALRDGGRVTLAIAPPGIPLVTPLTLEVWLAGMRAPERVEIGFRGVDMEMGYNRFALTAVPATEQTPAVVGDYYRGSGILPLCVRQRMRWEARVLLFEPERIRAAAFRFETRRGD